MGWSERDVMIMRCMKHPKHRQSAGVCALCLIERLSDLASANNTKANNQQAASYYSPSDASTSYSTVSSPSSPAEGAARSMFFSGPLLGGGAPMFRSKSVAVVVERPAPPGKERRRRSGTGFWSKLMRVGIKRRKAPAPAASSALDGVRN